MQYNDELINALTHAIKINACVNAITNNASTALVRIRIQKKKLLPDFSVAVAAGLFTSHDDSNYNRFRVLSNKIMQILPLF